MFSFSNACRCGGESLEHKTEKITFRVTPKELKVIEKKSEKSNLKISEYVRCAALDKKIIVIDDLRDIATNLKGVSKNLNQALILAHKGYIKEIDIEPTKEQVEEIWQLLNSLMVKMKK